MYTIKEIKLCLNFTVTWFIGRTSENKILMEDNIIDRFGGRNYMVSYCIIQNIDITERDVLF